MLVQRGAPDVLLPAVEPVDPVPVVLVEPVPIVPVPMVPVEPVPIVPVVPVPIVPEPMLPEPIVPIEPLVLVPGVEVLPLIELLPEVLPRPDRRLVDLVEVELDIVPLDELMPLWPVVLLCPPTDAPVPPPVIVPDAPVEPDIWALANAGTAKAAAAMR